MYRIVRRAALVLALGVLSAPSGACFHDKDDDDKAPVPNEWLQGPYWVVGFEHDYAAGAHIAVTGTVTFDGAGGYGGNITMNVDGAIGSQSLASTCEVTSDGALTLDDGSGGVMAGGLDRAHAIAIAARVTPGTNPLIVIAIKRAPAYASDSVSGDYHVAACQWQANETTQAYLAATGVGTFADGLFSGVVTMNWGGTIFEQPYSLPYSVYPDGAFALTDPNDPQFQMTGGVLEGGDVVACATIGIGNGPMILVAVRKSGAFTAATMAGPHRTVSMGASGTGASSMTGERVFDGTSDWSATWTANNNGAVGPASSTGTYTITSDGRLTLWNGLREFRLGVRESGRTAAGAVVTAGEAPRFVFSVRP